MWERQLPKVTSEARRNAGQGCGQVQAPGPRAAEKAQHPLGLPLRSEPHLQTNSGVTRLLQLMALPDLGPQTGAALPQTHCVTWAGQLSLSGLSFPFCKMDILMLRAKMGGTD